MVAANPSLESLSEADRQILESWLVSFDQTWSESRLVEQVRELPAAGSPLRMPALRELVKIDLERQWQRGNRRTLDFYLAAYPELGSRDEVSAELLHAEYEVLRQFDAAPPLDDFARRHPSQAAVLRRLAQAISDGSSSLIDNDNLNTIEPSSPTVREAPSAEEPRGLPEVFGRYRILKTLGKGGMGSVYLARDSQLDRDVALKVPFFRQDDDPDILRRFHREAQAAAALSHPNICPVHDVGAIDGIHFLTMAYIRGQSLTDAAKFQKPFPQDKAVRIVRTIALALAQAHRHGVIHRDLKPSNVMLDPSGEPVIMDFGLARRLDKEDVRLTKSGAIIGSPAYMSPEQVDGETEAIGPLSDVYSLGVILYELLAGQLPFQGTLISIFYKILNDSPPLPSTLRADLDTRLDAICLKAMAKKPADRFASMENFAAALAEILNTSAPATPVVKKSPPTPRRWFAAAFAAAAFLLLGGVIYMTTGRNDGKIDGDDKTASSNPKLPHDQEGELKSKPILANIRPGQAQPFLGHSAPVTSVAFADDGKQIVSAADDKTVRHWDLTTGKERTESRFQTKDGTAEKFVLAPDGGRFLYQTMSAVILGDSTTKAALKQTNIATHVSPHKAFAGNGRRVMVGAMGTFGETFVWVWDLETDQKFRFKNHAKLEHLGAVAISADGKKGVSVGQDGVRCWDVDPVKEYWRLDRPSVTALAFSPDGQFVATGAMLGTLLLHNAETGAEVGRFDGHNGAITCIVFSTDGRRLLTGSADKSVRLWDVAERKELARDDGHTDAVQCVALSRDGGIAASGSKDRTVRVWSIAVKTTK